MFSVAFFKGYHPIVVCTERLFQLHNLMKEFLNCVTCSTVSMQATPRQYLILKNVCQCWHLQIKTKNKGNTESVLKNFPLLPVAEPNSHTGLLAIAKLVEKEEFELPL